MWVFTIWTQSTALELENAMDVSTCWHHSELWGHCSGEKKFDGTILYGNKFGLMVSAAKKNISGTLRGLSHSPGIRTELRRRVLHASEVGFFHDQSPLTDSNFRANGLQNHRKPMTPWCFTKWICWFFSGQTWGKYQGGILKVWFPARSSTSQKRERLRFRGLWRWLNLGFLDDSVGVYQVQFLDSVFLSANLTATYHSRKIMAVASLLHASSEFCRTVGGLNFKTCSRVAWGPRYQLPVWKAWILFSAWTTRNGFGTEQNDDLMIWTVK